MSKKGHDECWNKQVAALEKILVERGFGYEKISYLRKHKYGHWNMKMHEMLHACMSRCALRLFIEYLNDLYYSYKKREAHSAMMKELAQRKSKKKVRFQDECDVYLM